MTNPEQAQMQNQEPPELSAPAAIDFEQERLKIDQRKIRVDENRLELDRQKALYERRWMNRVVTPLLPVLIASVFSLFGVLGAAWITHIFAQAQKDREVAVANAQKDKEMSLLKAQQDRQWHLDAAKFVSENADVIFGPGTDKQKRLAKVMAVTFPPEICDALFAKLAEPQGKNASPNTWEQARRDLKPNPNEARINFTVVDKSGDRLQHVLVQFTNADNDSGLYEGMTDNNGVGVVFLPVQAAGTFFRVLVTKNNYEPRNDVMSVKPGIQGASFTINPIPPSQ
jgi:hypothetical protein